MEGRLTGQCAQYITHTQTYAYVHTHTRARAHADVHTLNSHIHRSGALEAVDLLVRCQNLLPSHLAPVRGFTVAAEEAGARTAIGIPALGFSSACVLKVISVNGTGTVYSDGRAHDLLALESVALSEMQRPGTGLLLVGQAGRDSVGLSAAVSSTLDRLLSDNSLPMVAAVDTEILDRAASRIDWSTSRVLHVGGGSTAAGSTGAAAAVAAAQEVFEDKFSFGGAGAPLAIESCDSVAAAVARVVEDLVMCRGHGYNGDEYRDGGPNGQRGIAEEGQRGKSVWYDHRGEMSTDAATSGTPSSRIRAAERATEREREREREGAVSIADAAGGEGRSGGSIRKGRVLRRGDRRSDTRMRTGSLSSRVRSLSLRSSSVESAAGGWAEGGDPFNKRRDVAHPLGVQKGLLSGKKRGGKGGGGSLKIRDEDRSVSPVSVLSGWSLGGGGWSAGKEDLPWVLGESRPANKQARDSDDVMGPLGTCVGQGAGGSGGRAWVGEGGGSSTSSKEVLSAAECEMARRFQVCEGWMGEGGVPSSKEVLSAAESKVARRLQVREGYIQEMYTLTYEKYTKNIHTYV